MVNFEIHFRVLLQKLESMMGVNVRIMDKDLLSSIGIDIVSDFSIEYKGLAAISSSPMYLNTDNPEVKSVKDFTQKEAIALWP